MKVLMLHDAVPATAPPDAQDTLVQAAAVSAALGSLGHDVVVYALDGDLPRMRRAIEQARPQLIFNLVESIAGSDAAAVGAPALIDGLGVPYTGSPAAAIALSNDKCAAKALFVRLQLPTPQWCTNRPAGHFRAGRYIIKSRFEHASIGLEADAIAFYDDPDVLARAVANATRAQQRPCFAERFIDGREFNLSVIEFEDGVRVLPAAEIDFSAFPTGALRLVGYRAKWDETSFEYQNTPRRFDFESGDRALVNELSRLALDAFDALQLAGYARVDFRVDADGPWILEVNTNPCIAPDAGFAAALHQAGIPYTEAIAHIVRAAMKDY